jgi:hypothetical protein
MPDTLVDWELSEQAYFVQGGSWEVVTEYRADMTSDLPGCPKVIRVRGELDR